MIGDPTIDSGAAPLIEYDASAESEESKTPTESKLSRIRRLFSSSNDDQMKKVSFKKVCFERFIYVKEIKYDVQHKSKITHTPPFTDKSYVRFHHVGSCQDFLKSERGHSFFPVDLFGISVNRENLEVNKKTKKKKFSFSVDGEQINIRIVPCAIETIKGISLVSKGSDDTPYHTYEKVAKAVTVRTMGWAITKPKEQRQGPGDKVLYASYRDETDFVYKADIYYGEHAIYKAREKTKKHVSEDQRFNW